MANTPEGKVKDKINKLLDSYGEAIYRFMPVQMGYGRKTVDYLLCVRGSFVAIEAKRPGGVPTPQQEDTLAQVEGAGGRSFVVDGDDQLAVLKHFLDTIVGKNP